MAFAETRIRSLETARECVRLVGRPVTQAMVRCLAPSRTHSRAVSSDLIRVSANAMAAA